MPDLSQLIDLEAVSMTIVIVLVFGVVAIGIACSFVIFILRNLREYGILKAMGVGTGEMASLIVAKVMLMNLLACGVGGVAALAGKSGSGKTTLLSCMGGFETPDEGEVVCFGTSIHRLSARELNRFQSRRLGFVFQRDNLLSYLTVAENIGLPLTLNHIDGRQRRLRIEALLGAIDLKSAADALPHELSSGETQRVSVARAIAHRPALLLADEPTANLDTATGQRVVQLMLALGAENRCTILMATHDREISAIAGMAIHLRDGSVIKEVS